MASVQPPAAVVSAGCCALTTPTATTKTTTQRGDDGILTSDTRHPILYASRDDGSELVEQHYRRQQQQQQQQQQQATESLQQQLQQQLHEQLASLQRHNGNYWNLSNLRAYGIDTSVVPQQEQQQQQQQVEVVWVPLLKKTSPATGAAQAHTQTQAPFAFLPGAPSGQTNSSLGSLSSFLPTTYGTLAANHLPSTSAAMICAQLRTDFSSNVAGSSIQFAPSPTATAVIQQNMNTGFAVPATTTTSTAASSDDAYSLLLAQALRLDTQRRRMMVANSEPWQDRGGFAGTPSLPPARNEYLPTSTTTGMKSSINLTSFYPNHHPFALSSSSGTTNSTTNIHGLGPTPLGIHNNPTRFSASTYHSVTSEEENARESILSPQLLALMMEMRRRDEEQQQRCRETMTRENDTTTPPLIPLSASYDNPDLSYCQQNHKNASIEDTLMPMQHHGGEDSQDNPSSSSLTTTAHCVMKANANNDSEQRLGTSTTEQQTKAEAADGSSIPVSNERNSSTEADDEEASSSSATATTTTTTKPGHGNEGSNNQNRNLFLACEKPKRPRTAYNFFFQHERQILLHQQKQLDAQQQYWKEQTHHHRNVLAPAVAAPPSKYRRGGGHRPHGVGFAPMAQAVSQKWHALSAQQRAPYKALEVQDKERYRQERALYLKYQQAACREAYQELAQENQQNAVVAQE